jgi:hypothetical protein
MPSGHQSGEVPDTIGIAIPSDLRTLEEFEKWLHDEIVMSDDRLIDEYWGIFTTEGQLVICGYIPGPKPSHRMTREESALARGNIMSHNHPSGFPFSIFEIPVAADLNLRESRVITREWLYSIAPNPRDGRWPSPCEISRVIDEITADISLSFPITHNDSNPECIHQRYKILAERAGFDYSREAIA